jgi:hypothetical protein
MRGFNIKDRELERQGERMAAPARGFLLVAAIMAIPGLFFVVTDLAQTLGVVMLVLASLPGVVGLGLLISASVARWAARHKLFA